MTAGSRPEGSSLRMRKPGIRDPKLLIGLLLVMISVMAVIGIVRASNRTETFYAAAQDIHVGDRVTADKLRKIEVRLGDSSSLYLSTEVGEAVYAVDNIQAGELISKQDLAQHDSHGRRATSIVLDTAIAQGFTNGERVDIWIASKAESGKGYDAPRVIAEAAEISHVTAEESMIGGTGKSAVHLLIDEDSLPAMLAAVNNEDKINLIPSSFVGASS